MRRFIARLSIPVIPKTEANKQNLDVLKQAMDDLRGQTRSSTRKCCFCFNRDDRIFGRLDQARYILEETFDGRHFYLDGPDGNIIDCMFFPCTSKEKVLVDETAPINGKKKQQRRKS